MLRVVRTARQAGIKFLTLDNGPGMDVAASMRDGRSTAGTLGIGLGMIARLAASGITLRSTTASAADTRSPVSSAVAIQGRIASGAWPLSP
ncbi:hypothetical protein YW7DRAFT_06580 [Streptomyces sp. AmelKG-E11A]|nr:hypothetical protein YW7DRAFT_06580 [Streptomyces sp. AmelKG-E11A]